jgi:hypothetical protein
MQHYEIFPNNVNNTLTPLHFAKDSMNIYYPGKTIVAVLELS